MNQITPFETIKVKGLFVVVPKDAESFDVFSVGYTAPLEFGCSLANGKTFTLTLPHGNWQLLGLLNEVSEKQAKIVMGFDKRFCGTVPYSIVNQASLNKLARSLKAPENSVVLIEKK